MINCTNFYKHKLGMTKRKGEIYQFKWGKTMNETIEFIGISLYDPILNINKCSQTND